MKNSLKTVLVVEDDGMLRDVVVKYFQGTFNVLSAEDGEKAITITMDKKPDVILLDLLLPKVDGFQVLETIRKSKDKAVSGIPVVVLSNLWTNKDILRVEALKIEAYFVKAHTELEQVYKKVQEILGVK